MTAPLQWTGTTCAARHLTTEVVLGCPPDTGAQPSAVLWNSLAGVSRAALVQALLSLCGTANALFASSILFLAFWSSTHSWQAAFPQVALPNVLPIDIRFRITHWSVNMSSRSIVKLFVALGIIGFLFCAGGSYAYNYWSTEYAESHGKYLKSLEQEAEFEAYRLKKKLNTLSG